MKTNTLMPLGVRGALIAMGAVAIFASLAIFAYADAAPSVTATAYNSSNVAVSSLPIGSTATLVTSVASSSTTTLPTGSVTFNRYDNTSCSGTPTTESGVALVNGIATSSSATMTASGLSYLVQYGGDSFNVSANSACVHVDSQGNSTTLTESLSSNSVLAGSSITASATIAGATANAGGTVTYTVYSNDSCTTLWGNAGSKTVSNALVSASDPFSFGTAGSYWWQAVYSGDGSNAAATSSCLALSVLSNNASSSAAISGTVYNDLNSNQSKDSGENGLSGFTVRLHQGSTIGGSVLASATTDGSGNYSFGSLADGTYSLELVSMNGWNVLSSNYVNLVISNQASLSGKNYAVVQPTTANPGPGSISGTFYNDANHNDKLDSGEQRLSGFTVNLYKGAGWWGKKGNNDVFMSKVTDGSGNYSFTGLADGVYSIEEIEMKGWSQTTSDYKSVTIKNGSVLTGKDFGNVAISTSTTHGGHGDNDNDNDDHGNKGEGGNHWGWFNNLWGRFSSSTGWGNNK